MNNLSQMNLILNMGNVNSSISAKWNDFRMYMDNGVTPAQIYAAEKGYYLGSFSGGIDFTGQGQQGVFLQTSPLGSSTPSGTGMVASVSASHGNNGITANPGQVGVTPPYLFASDGSKNLFGGHAVPIDDTTLTHFSVWVNPVGTIPGGILMRHQYSPDVTITLSMTSTRQITGTVVKGGFTRTLSALGSSIPLNTWSMVSISVILANTEPCYLSVDGVAYSGGGATGGGVTMTNATFTVTMMGSPNLRFNQMIVHKQAWFTLPAMYEASKSSYGRV
jgi:hypothetical protein